MRGPYTEPLFVSNKPPDSLQVLDSSGRDEVEHREAAEDAVSAVNRTEEAGEEPKRDSLSCPQTLISEPSYKRGHKVTTVPELELRKLERGKIPPLHSVPPQGGAVFPVLNLGSPLISPSPLVFQIST